MHLVAECLERTTGGHNSLLYLVFQTALCYSVVSGCFVHGASPSASIRPEPAPKRGLGGSGLAFRRPESARKVHAKSFGLKCGSGQVVVLRIEVDRDVGARRWLEARLGLNFCV